MLTLGAEDRQRIGRAIKIARSSCGVTQVVLSQNVGISQVALSHVECGRNCPSLPLVIRIAEYLGVSFDVLLGRS